MLSMPAIAEKKAFLKSKGLKDPINFFQLHRPDVPWLSQTLIGASLPLDVVPQNVTCTGPITLLLATVDEQDKELAKWLARAPTVMVNLGSAYKYTESHATAMAQGLAKLLSETDVQVLWKVVPDGIGDEFMGPLQPFVKSGRARVSKWLQADPPSLLVSGHIAASVHHGGSGCYHEAIGSGVPQVILPQWLDLYGFAQLSEDVGVGVWGCRESSPYWTGECIYESILRVIRSDESQAMQDKAKKLSASANERRGRYIAAEEVARLAGSGV